MSSVISVNSRVKLEDPSCQEGFYFVLQQLFGTQGWDGPPAHGHWGWAGVSVTLLFLSVLVQSGDADRQGGDRGRGRAEISRLVCL